MKENKLKTFAVNDRVSFWDYRYKNKQKGTVTEIIGNQVVKVLVDFEEFSYNFHPNSLTKLVKKPKPSSEFYWIYRGCNGEIKYIISKKLTSNPWFFFKDVSNMSSQKYWEKKMLLIKEVKFFDENHELMDKPKDIPLE